MGIALRRVALINKQNLSIFISLLFCVLFSNYAFAQEVNDIAEGISDSAALLPALISALAYLSGALITVTAIFKLIDHVNNPGQTPIRVPVIRFLVGGGLFALPVVLEAAINTINGGSVVNFSTDSSVLDVTSGGLITAGVLTGNFSGILHSISIAIDELPALIAAVAYLLGVVLAVSAIYKTRDHVEDPDRSPLKDAVIRYLIAGALFALPTIYEAFYNAFADTGFLSGIIGVVSQLFITASFLLSSEAGGLACGAFGSGKLSDVVCTTMLAIGGLPAFLTGISYLIGLAFGFWGIMKIRDHVNNPTQVALSEGIMRLMACGAFLALPVVSMTLAYSVTPLSAIAVSAVGSNTGFNETLGACAGTNSLDQAMGCFMDDLLGPGHVLLNLFSYIAGIIFIMIGISRLTKSAQEGPRGPGGVGTVTTFVIGAVLMSATTIMHAFSSSFFNSGITTTDANLTYTGGMTVAETQAAYNVISAVLKFMIIIGMISFVRGIFIMRDVSEGSQQASTMAGITHIIGGALAVNLGPLLNAVQTTLGVTAFGVTFS